MEPHFKGAHQGSYGPLPSDRKNGYSVSQARSQGNVKTMTPEKPKTPPPKPSGTRPYDPLLDPLPLPEVVESDSDTAWGLWEDSLQTPHAEQQDTQVQPLDRAYDDTEPMDLTDPTTKKPPPRGA